MSEVLVASLGPKQVREALENYVKERTINAASYVFTAQYSVATPVKVVVSMKRERKPRVRKTQAAGVA